MRARDASPYCHSERGYAESKNLRIYGLLCITLVRRSFDSLRSLRMTGKTDAPARMSRGVFLRTSDARPYKMFQTMCVCSLGCGRIWNPPLRGDTDCHGHKCPRNDGWELGDCSSIQEIATTSLRTGLAMTGRNRHPGAVAPGCFFRRILCRGRFSVFRQGRHGRHR